MVFNINVKVEIIEISINIIFQNKNINMVVYFYVYHKISVLFYTPHFGRHHWTFYGFFLLNSSKYFSEFSFLAVLIGCIMEENSFLPKILLCLKYFSVYFKMVQLPIKICFTMIINKVYRYYRIIENIWKIPNSGMIVSRMDNGM